MIEMDESDTLGGSLQADALPRHHQPAYDANRRWYEEYLTMMRRANAILLDKVKALRHAEDLRRALTDMLAETEGGNFLGPPTRDRAQQLLRNRFTPLV
jgi:hypothetical protein